MGKVLRREHIGFFYTKMDEHNLVKDVEVIDNQDEYLFKVRRTLKGMSSDVIVHLTDAYRYGLAEFMARPDRLGRGSFVVLGMPHADFDTDVVEVAKKARIGIGHIGKFMGALNYTNIWEYMTPDERKQKENQQHIRTRGKK